MYTNRIQHHALQRLPETTTEIPPANFVMYPLAWAQGMMLAQVAAQQWIYQRAFEEARAVVRPSWLERDLLGVWN